MLCNYRHFQFQEQGLILQTTLKKPFVIDIVKKVVNAESWEKEDISNSYQTI